MGRKRGLVPTKSSEGGSSQQPPLLSKTGANRRGSRLDSHESDFDPRPRTRLPTWSSRNDRILLDVLAEHQAQGRGVGGLFPSSSWPKIIEDFNASSGLSLKKEHLQNRLKTMKGTYSLMKPLIERSGWSIDRTTFTVVALGPTEWDCVITVNSKYASVRGKPFPIYYELEALCGRNIAMGKNSMSTTMQEMLGKGSDEDSDDPVDERSVWECSTTKKTLVSEEGNVIEEVQVERGSGGGAAVDVAPRVGACCDLSGIAWDLALACFAQVQN